MMCPYCGEEMDGEIAIYEPPRYLVEFYCVDECRSENNES